MQDLLNKYIDFSKAHLEPKAIACNEKTYVELQEKIANSDKGYVSAKDKIFGLPIYILNSIPYGDIKITDEKIIREIWRIENEQNGGKLF